MKKLTLSLFAFFLIFGAFAQEVEVKEGLDKKTQKKYLKEERKREKQAELEQKKAELEEMLESKQFVLEASFLSGRRGTLVPVVENLNFMAIDSSDAVMQIGSVSGVGYNGVGGVTEEGRVTEYEITETKSGYTAKIYMMGNLSTYTIFLNANAGGRSTARVTGLSGGVLTFHGELVPTYASNVYQGMTTY